MAGRSSADDWDNQMGFFVAKGVAGHRSRPPGSRTVVAGVADGHDMDPLRGRPRRGRPTHLNLKNAIHVGHSTGGGEVVRYIALTATSRVAKAEQILSAVPPLMIKTAGKPRRGFRKSVFDELPGSAREEPLTVLPGPRRRDSLRIQSPRERSRQEAIIQNWWRQGMMGGAKAHYDGVVAFSQTDFTEDLKQNHHPGARDARRRRSDRPFTPIPRRSRRSCSRTGP